MEQRLTDVCRDETLEVSKVRKDLSMLISVKIAYSGQSRDIVLSELRDYHYFNEILEYVEAKYESSR
jgi:hypothetical protein